MGSRDEFLERLRETLRAWKQGDCVLGGEFVYQFCPEHPLTPTEEELADPGSTEDLVATAVPGFVFVSQTCDIVRDPAKRPWIEVAALTEVSEDVLREVRKGRRPRYVYVPALEERLLVGDLDRIMTIEKGCLLEWERVPGCSDEKQQRRFAWAVARKRGRPAFPDDFVEVVKPLLARIKEKNGKDSPEGRAIDALREIRVTASPSWDANHVSLFFHFIAEDESTSQRECLAGFLEGWLGRVRLGGRFVECTGIACTLQDVVAKEYLESDPLDLDYLSF